jgi:hypothetical protein
MSFRISGLDPAPFQHLFGLSEPALAYHGAIRYVADKPVGFPDRIELADAAVGQSVLLINYLFQPAETPYRGSHAIFVREGATKTFDAVDEVPPALRGRILSIRAFDTDHMMIDADIVDGSDAEALIDRLFASPNAAYLQAHFAKRGCFAARIDRA